MKKLMLIVNPVAGRGGFKTLFGEAMLTLANGGLQPDLYFTQNRGDATERLTLRQSMRPNMTWLPVSAATEP